MMLLHMHAIDDCSGNENKDDRTIYLLQIPTTGINSLNPTINVRILLTVLHIFHYTS